MQQNPTEMKLVNAVEKQCKLEIQRKDERP